ncbi:MAG TPA: glycosyltransferase family 4 protein [Thermoplasmata archaeon]|nr:glycosyltransferase family 4 protein [Thermoplasmata archaeon]
MRIALVVLRYDAPGGVETTARQLAHGYLALGHEVEIFASDLYDEGSWDRRTNFAPTFEGAPVHRFPVYRRLLPRVTFVTMPGLMRALVERGPDVIEVHSHRYGQVLQAAAVSLGTGIPVVVGTHYHPADVRAPWYKRGILRVQDHAFGMTAYRVARFLVVETQTEADQLAEFSPREKIRVVPPGLELDEWFADEPEDPANPLFAGLPDQFLLYAGRIAENKGIEFLLEAYARLDPGDRRPIVLMGKDWGMGPQLRAQAERLGIADRLTWLGHVPSRADYRAVFRRASALVLPSEYEAFGFVLMEAMSVGLPIVATSVGAVPEVLEHGGIGELISFGDVPALTSALRRLVREPDRWSARIARGRVRVRDFAVERMVEGHLALYREALA